MHRVSQCHPDDSEGCHNYFRNGHADLGTIIKVTMTPFPIVATTCSGTIGNYMGKRHFDVTGVMVSCFLCQI